MKKLIVVGSGVVGALAVSALLGSGAASADDYAGQKYSDAPAPIVFHAGAQPLFS